MNKLVNFALAATALALCSPAISQDKVNLTMGSAPAGSTVGQFGIAFSQVAQKHAPVQIQVSVGKTATKMAIDAVSETIALLTLKGVADNAILFDEFI